MNKRPPKKTKIHPRNKHIGNYNFEELIETLPELKAFVKPNNFKQLSIDFFNPNAVKALNKALLKKYYGIEYWDIPQDFLCPPIPGRADYIHHLADLLAWKNTKTIHTGDKLIPNGKKIKILDVGVGANCIYPIIGNVEYGWSFVGSDSYPKSVDSARKIVDGNDSLKIKVSIRQQHSSKNIFKGIIKEDELYDATLCNPPFHTSKEDAEKGTMQKLKSLKNSKTEKLVKNFGGQNNELWCAGGEVSFIKTMIIQSKSFGKQCFWFTSLVSKESNLKSVYQMLKKAKVVEMRTIKMAQGNKQSRFVAWTFLDKTEQEKWANTRWFENKA